MAATESVARATSNAAKSLDDPVQHYEDLDPERRTDQTLAMLTTMGVFCLFFLIIVALIHGPMILLAIGWASGQSCDQPIDEFCKRIIILTLAATVLNGSVDKREAIIVFVRNQQ